MVEKDLKNLFNNLTFWEMKNRDKITKKIRYKHFMEDLAILLVSFETEGFSDRVIKMKRQGLQGRLAKIFGVKEVKLKSGEVQKEKIK